MLSPKIAQNFARALSYFEVHGLDDWADLVSEEVNSAVQKCSTHSCLRCAHACIAVEAWLEHEPGADQKKPPTRKVVSVAHRACGRFVRLNSSENDDQCFSLADVFFCPWEERVEAAGGPDE